MLADYNIGHWPHASQPLPIYNIVIFHAADDAFAGHAFGYWLAFRQLIVYRPRWLLADVAFRLFIVLVIADVIVIIFFYWCHTQYCHSQWYRLRHCHWYWLVIDDGQILSCHFFFHIILIAIRRCWLAIILVIAMSLILSLHIFIDAISYA